MRTPRLFGTTGNCAACSKLIPAFEMVMRARDNVYHLDCFACQLCNQRTGTCSTGTLEDTQQPPLTRCSLAMTVTLLPAWAHYKSQAMLNFAVIVFCVGDKFFLKNNMILCQMDYEEGQLNGSFETPVQ
ncbi:hypothetical protein CRUP_032019 [Coryphaenoides rupestris]|nr:hypothetical protein CRUP_032019 [Coryphaenoides rupestris]